MAKLDYIAILRALTDEANIERLLTTLESLDARYRIRPERKLTPQASHLR